MIKLTKEKFDKSKKKINCTCMCPNCGEQLLNIIEKYCFNCYKKYCINDDMLEEIKAEDK